MGGASRSLWSKPSEVVCRWGFQCHKNFGEIGVSKLTASMRCFDELIRESKLIDPPLRNAIFTWSNMQASPVCKRDWIDSCSQMS